MWVGVHVHFVKREARVHIGQHLVSAAATRMAQMFQLLQKTMYRPYNLKCGCTRFWVETNLCKKIYICCLPWQLVCAIFMN